MLLARSTVRLTDLWKVVQVDVKVLSQPVLGTSLHSHCSALADVGSLSPLLFLVNHHIVGSICRSEQVPYHMLLGRDSPRLVNEIKIEVDRSNLGLGHEPSYQRNL